jgi:hypothetical protein
MRLGGGGLCELDNEPNGLTGVWLICCHSEGGFIGKYCVHNFKECVISNMCIPV